MKIFPNVKECQFKEGYISLGKILWLFSENTDERIKKAAFRITESNDTGTPVIISHNEGTKESYTIEISECEIKINGDSAKGAFYALETLKALIKNNEGNLKCCMIRDYPDMKYRGFYQDTTRGRIPTVDTLKNLIDKMAEFKMNSLQLYVEHSYEFKEYDFCSKELGFLTKEEIMEVDKYCKDRFIDLIPSLSCFGHLYHLLQSDKYKHLCELKDYKPSKHHYFERMKHHTINPLLDESFELIKSLIDQHMEAFTSDYFNICCDETFDLGTDVNKDKDKGELYVGFVTKLANYIKSKGKTPMMWGDIALEHSDKLVELPYDIIFLNWDYRIDPSESNVATLENKKQIVCPGTSSWYGFSERTFIEEGNILKFAEYGYKHNALGLLNTNWGDRGNLASIDMATYGLVLGALVSWDRAFVLNDEVKKQISENIYGNADAVKILDIFCETEKETHWSNYFDKKEDIIIPEVDFIVAAKKYEKTIKKLNDMEFSFPRMKSEFLLAAKGYYLMLKWYAKSFKVNVVCNINFEEWLKEYKASWLVNSKKSELDNLEEVFVKSEKGEF